MKRVSALIVGGVLVASVAVGQGAWAMPMPAADSKESKSPADKIQDVIDDLDSQSIFTNPMGYLAGNTYVNDSMGISLMIPDSFTVFPAQNSEGIKYLVLAQDEATQEAFQLVEVDLVAANEEGLTEEECLEQYKEGMESSGGFTTVSEKLSSAQLGSDTYTVLDMTIDLDGMSGNVKNYCRIDGTLAYILTGISFEGVDEGVRSIIDSIVPVEFGVWHGRTYTNPLFGISMTFPDELTLERSFAIEEGAVYPAAAVNEENGTSVQIVVMDFHSMDGGYAAYEDFDSEDVLRSFNEGIEDTIGISMADGVSSEVMIGNEEFSLITVNADDGDYGPIEMRSYGQVEDGYAMVIFAMGTTGEMTEVDELMDAVLPSNVGTIDEETRTYMNTSLQMAMTLPEGWDIVKGYTKENNYDMAFQIGDYETGENILLQVYDLEEIGEEDLTEEAYAKEIRAQLENAEDTVVGEETDSVVLKGIPYRIVHVESTVPGGVLEQNICYHIGDGELHVFYMTANPDNYSEGYMSVLESMGF